MLVQIGQILDPLISSSFTKMPYAVAKEYLTLKHKDKRPREYLFEHEIESMLKACSQTQNTIRNRTLILLTYRHGFRAGEICNLKWSQIDYTTNRIHVNRQKGGVDSVHPIRDREIRLLKQLYGQRISGSPYVFHTNRGTKFTVAAFQKMISMIAEKAKLDIPMVHPHMLRHSTGYKLANDKVGTRTIQDYLGHANINNTVIYTKLASNRFDNLFLD